MAQLIATSEDTRVYEVAVLYVSSLPQKEEQQLLKDVELLLKDAGGTQIAKDLWGKRGMAYSIQGQREGNFVIYHYELPPEKLKEIEHDLRIMKGVLRHLVIKPPKHYEVVKYSEKFEQWQKSQEEAEEEKEKEREETLKKKVLAKAKREAKLVEKRAAVKEERGGMEKEEMAEEIEKLISEDGLEL